MRRFFKSEKKSRQSNPKMGIRHKGLRLESLEDRLLLTAVPNGWGLLATETEVIGPSGSTTLAVQIAPSSGDAVIGFLATPTEGSDLDLGRIAVENKSGEDITASSVLHSSLNYNGTSSLVLLKLSAGEYKLNLSAENNSTGNFVCHLFFPGDVDGNGRIDSAESNMGAVYATATDAHLSGNWTQGAFQFYQTQYGIDLADWNSVYNARYDANMDGIINSSDVSIFQTNVGDQVTANFVEMFDLTPINDSLLVDEGAVGFGNHSFDSWTATIKEASYVSTDFVMGPFVQTSATSSLTREIDFDFSSFLKFSEDGRFLFNATSGDFDFLKSGEKLTLAIDYYLGEVTFIVDGVADTYRNVKGGTITVVVTGVNDAPVGAGDYETSYDLATKAFSEPVNILTGVTDPDGDALTPSLIKATLDANVYEIPTDVDYSACFTISATGEFSLDAESLASLLTSVPAGQTVTFSIDYQVADSNDASIGGVITLTVTGQNDAPVGAGDYETSYDLATKAFSEPVSVLTGVTDPDGDVLTPSLIKTTLDANVYGIPTDVDYSSCFTVSATGEFSLDAESLASLLTSVPAGQTVTFSIDYQVADSSDASIGGVITLTVTGQNDAPVAMFDPLTLTEKISSEKTLTYEVNLLANLTDVDGDFLSVTSISLDGADYSVAELEEGKTIGDYLFRYDSITGILAVNASSEKVEELRWTYNGSDENPLLLHFDYAFTDKIASESASVFLYLSPSNDSAEITSQKSEPTVFQNAGASETDWTSLATAEFLSDREGYSVTIIVKDADGVTINSNDLSDLVKASIFYPASAPGGKIVFSMSDYLVNRLTIDAIYSVSYALQFNGVTEGSGQFEFVVKPFQVVLWSDSVSTTEGASGESHKELPQTAFTATINKIDYQSTGFTMGQMIQTGAVSSLAGSLNQHFSSFMTFEENNHFAFDASSNVFDFLKQGETLTVTFDFYLNDLTFANYDETFDNVKGGTITVVVTGGNDAPVGAGDYETSYDLATKAFSKPVNILTGVTDPDGDALTPSLIKATLDANVYGIPTDVDYSSCFTVSATGEFSLDGESLASLLTSVPAGQTVTFSIDYQVADSNDASIGGVITLTVTGQNETPVGAGDYETSYDLATKAFSKPVNILTGVTDPDGDALTPSLIKATLDANVYEIPTDVDYSACFTVSATGEFSLDAESLASLLTSVPAGQTVTFSIDYQVADSNDASIGGVITLTVTGQNETPVGAEDYETNYDLATKAFSEPVNILTGVTDPDGDALTPSLIKATLDANVYEIPTDVDYSACFTVSATGEFSLDAESLASLLTSVPAGQTVTFSIDYQVADSNDTSIGGVITLTVTGQNETPVGAGDYETSYDLATKAFSEPVNVLTGVTDPDGDVLTPSIIKATLDANVYGIPTDVDYSTYFMVSVTGDLSVNADSLATLLAFLPLGKSVTFTICYQTADSHAAADNGVVVLTANGSYEAPSFNGKIDDLTKSLSESISIDLARYFSGSVKDYSVILTGTSAILDSANPYSISGDTLTFHFLKTANYASNLDLSTLSAVVKATDGHKNDAVSNSFTLSLAEEFTSKISLVAVTENFGGVNAIELQTGRTQFGTFYYVNGDAVPTTDYEAIAQANEYSLEIWVQDLSFFITNQEKFLTSIQVQLNYDWSGNGITSVELEDVYAGNPALDSYLYYDDAETMLKAIQLTWLYGDHLNWSRMEPITNGENAFLLARLTVTANAISSITLSGADQPESPFVAGYYYVRTGEGVSLDNSQIKTVDLKAEKTSPIMGTSDAEYVVENGVYVRVVTDKTETDATGKTDQIGVNVDYLHEWQTHYAEIWVKTSDMEGLTAASTGLTFDPTYFTVTNIEFGDAFENGGYEMDAAAGTVTNLAATVRGGAISGGDYVLLARVQFQPVGDQGVAQSESLTPITLSWNLSNAVVSTVRGREVKSYLGKNASTELWANPYDVNDDGLIDVVDFVAFANKYGRNSVEDYAGLFFDFNRDGTIDVQDFTSFANYYGISRWDVVSGAKELIFPESFTQRYVGSSLDADNAALVGKIFDAAAEAWAEKLGLKNTFSATIVVKDLGTDELAKAQVTETDAETGLATRGIIYLDDDAAGNLWSSQLTVLSTASTRYDLYTVLLHELGHLYGYDCENNAFASIAGNFDYLTDGHSTDVADVMFATLEPGLRKELTDQDVAVILAIYASGKRDNAVESFLPVSELETVAVSKTLRTGDRMIEEYFATAASDVAEDFDFLEEIATDSDESELSKVDSLLDEDYFDLFSLK